MVGHVREAAAQQRLHDHGGDTAFLKLAVKIFGVGVARIHLFGMVPVDIVELYLHEIPLVFVVPRQQVVEYSNVAVIREPEVAYAAGLALLEKEIKNAVVDVTFAELFHTILTHSDTVQ